MEIPLYQVDAFATALFRGNPAAVCPLKRWPDDALLQDIAAENNLAETAFFVPEGDGFRLRWFTPTVEVDLCGHATLAAAFVLFHHREPGRREVRFTSRSGELRVTGEGDSLTLDFPRLDAAPIPTPGYLAAAIGVEPVAVFRGMDVMAVLETEAEVRAVKPDLEVLRREVYRGLIVTAPGEEMDFVSRFFAPAAGISEDPVTGSAHCMLAPYWSERLGKSELLAHQLSPRGGELLCRCEGDRVYLTGRGVLYLRGTIFVPDPD